MGMNLVKLKWIKVFKIGEIQKKLKDAQNVNNLQKKMKDVIILLVLIVNMNGVGYASKNMNMDIINLVEVVLDCNILRTHAFQINLFDFFIKYL